MNIVKQSLLATGALALSMGAVHVASANSTYQVKSGDTLSQISRVTHVSLSDLQRINHISNANVIFPGQTLQLDRQPVAPKAPVQQQHQQTSGDTTYTVKAGDTASRIASQFGLTLAELQSLNKIANINLIFVGQRLLVKRGGNVAVPTVTGTAKPQSAPQQQQAPQGGVYHVVRGDTMSGIAAKHNMSLSALLNMNGMNASQIIYVGQSIKVAGSAAEAKPVNNVQAAPQQQQAPQGAVYHVVSGDTMSAIAAKHNMSLSALLNMNGMNASQIIYVGQSIKVAGSAPAANNVQAAPQQQQQQQPAGNTNVSTYTIKSGDTLYGISRSHGMSLQALLSLNNISASSLILPGQVLKISGQASTPTQQVASRPVETQPQTQQAPASSATYTIKSGDNLYRIAMKSGMSLHDLLSMNNLSASSMIFPGQVLKVAGNSQPDTAPTTGSQSGQMVNLSNNNVSSTTVGDISTAGLSASQAAWLRQAAVDAKNATLGSGVLPSVTVAQAIIESNWGRSGLASAPYNNLFGIKAGGYWGGRQVVMPTGEYLNGRYVTVNAAFRAYDSQEASFRDHTNFLLQNSRYAANGVINAPSYQAMATGLQRAGYATDPSYAATLISVVQRYNLNALD